MGVNQAFSMLRGAQIAAAAGATGVPAPTATAVVQHLAEPALDEITLHSTADFTRLDASFLVEMSLYERTHRALLKAGAIDDEGLQRLTSWTQLVNTGMAELGIEEPASDQRASVVWWAAVATAPGDIRGLCDALGVEGGHTDALMERVAALDCARTMGAALVLEPGGAPQYRFRLLQNIELDHLFDRVLALDAAAATLPASDAQRRWFRAVFESLTKARGRMFAPVELEVGPGGVAPTMRVSLAQVAERSVVKVVDQFSTDESAARRLGAFVGTLGETETFEWLHLTLRDTEPPGVGFAVKQQGLPGITVV